MTKEKLFLKYHWLIIVLFILAIAPAITPAIISFFCPQLFIKLEDQLTLGNWIYWVTFLALIWYADETRKIREIEQTPIIDLYATDEDIVRISKLTIQNNGKGIAYSVKIENIITDKAEFDIFIDDLNNILLAGGCRDLDVVAKTKGGSLATNRGDAYFSDNSALDKFTDEIMSKRGEYLKVVIVYQNYLGKHFKSVFGVSFPLFAEKDKDKNATFKKAVSVVLLSRS